MTDQIQEKLLKLLPMTALALLLSCESLTPSISDLEQTPAEQDVAEQASVEQAFVDQTIIKSPNDPRRYRHKTLPNGLRLLLISDPSADKSAAALVAFRGSFHDPEDRPGLAHFLEHMLFIGTEKYPEPDGYFAFVEKHGGGSNAYTAPDHTNYFFDIQPEYFPEGLDRFAHFFIDPLLDQAYVDREKNAVHSEYQMQIKDDGWRGFAVQKVALNPEHPFSKFNIGTLDTLSGDIYDDLTDFFETHYSANQMGAVVIHREPLDTLDTWVSPLFGQIKNRNRARADFSMPLTTPGRLPATLKHQTLKSNRSVSYAFPIPAIDPHYATKPTGYLGSLIGHEGEGSLHQRLSNEGWITALGAGAQNIDRSNAVFEISIDLTESGFEHVDDITDLVFDSIDMLRESKPQAWLYDEAATVANLGFRFREQIPSIATVQSLAPNLMKFPTEDLLVAPYLLENFDPGLIESFLGFLTPENVLKTIAGPDIEGDSREPWFDVAYTLSPGISRGEQPNDGLRLPDPNPFLPKNLDLIAAETTPPRLIDERQGLGLYLAQDREFGIPRAIVQVTLRGEKGIISLEDTTRAALYSDLVEDNLNALAYPALLAGVGYGIKSVPEGFEIGLGGYEDKQIDLLREVIDRLTTMSIESERFEVLKKDFRESLENSLKNRPFQQAFGRLTDTLLSSSWTAEEHLGALDSMTPEDLTAWRDRYFEAINIEALVVGNVTLEDANKIEVLLSERFNLTDLTPASPVVTQIQGPTQTVLDIDHNDASMVLYLQNDNASIEETAKTRLLAHVISPKYFSSLRTEQQLGYVVQAFSPEFERQSGLGFVIQSPSAPASALISKTLEFLKGEVSRVKTMTPESYSENQQGLVSSLLEKDKNLGERANRYWSDLEDGYLNFDGRAQMADAIVGVSQPALINHLESMIAKSETDYLVITSTGRFAQDEPETKTD